MIALHDVYIEAFDAINSHYYDVQMLDQPMWKWASLVEGWLWRTIEDESERERVSGILDAPIEYGWMAKHFAGGADAYRVPASWQTNAPGESLLSRHRGKAE